MRRVWLAALALVAAGNAAAQDGAYLFDLMKQRTYRAAWDGMMKGEEVDGWLADYSRTLDGVATPSALVTVAGQPALAAFVCKPHDCGANQFAVLFTGGGKRAVGALVVDEGAPRWFGTPTRAERAALQQALSQ